jgi:hypothetical protein
MKRVEIPIPLPCLEDWDTMTVAGRARFCGVCKKHVHDLSRMSEIEGRALLEESPQGSLCVRYLADQHEEILFGLVEAGFVPVANLRRSKAKRASLTFGAGVAAAGLSTLMACGGHQATAGAPMPSPRAGAPMSIEPSPSGTSAPQAPPTTSPSPSSAPLPAPSAVSVPKPG